MLYGRLYTYGRRYGLEGSGTKVFMGKVENTSSVSLPSPAFGFEVDNSDYRIKFATFQYEVRMAVGEGPEL